MKTETLSPDLLYKMDAYWRAANDLSVGQIHLYDNPLLREPQTLAHIEPLVVGHWVTVPGQNFIYVHLNRAIQKLEADVRRLVEKYLAIAEWDVPEIDEPLASRLVIAAVRQALDRAEKALPDPQA